MQYAISALLALAVGVILWLIKKDRIAMDYEVISSQAYPHESGRGRYFIVTFRNTGNRPIKDTTVQMVFATGSIEFVSLSDETLFSSQKQGIDSYSCIIPLLNPREMLSMTITTKDADIDTFPRISARAEGATAQERPHSERYTEYIPKLLAGLSVAVAASVAISTYSSFSQTKVQKSIESIKNIDGLSVEVKKTTESFEKASEELKTRLEKFSKQQQEWEQGKPETEQYVLGILNTSGLGHLMPALISAGGRLEYWRTGTFLLYNFLTDMGNSSKYLRAMEQLVAIEEMAPSSKGYNLYLLGKMAGFKGDKEKNLEYFAKCKKAAPLMYEYLMSQDPAFDMKSLQTVLRKHESH